jgi:hypothetical protein
MVRVLAQLGAPERPELGEEDTHYLWTRIRVDKSIIRPLPFFALLT